MYRKTRDADPSHWNSKISYEYAASSSTSTLRGHLEREHLDDYMALSKEKGWKHQLRSQARLNSEASVTSSTVPVDSFDEETFHQYLIRFIVTDDQVSSPPTLVNSTDVFRTFPYS